MKYNIFIQFTIKIICTRMLYKIQSDITNINKKLVILFFNLHIINSIQISKISFYLPSLLSRHLQNGHFLVFKYSNSYSSKK